METETMTRNQYARMYYQKMKENPDKYLKRMESIRRRRQQIKSDPTLYSEWKQKQREYARRTYLNKKLREAEAEANQLIETEV